jgi:hypothetical protein
LSEQRISALREYLFSGPIDATSENSPSTHSDE